ncbi:MAG: carboxypeptidase regulatory-like domain-containing protein [Desulfamplus sp.]|nr:carboxypeptidase regulatory-like domain-containing protein [Desulfamplus sp.]
MKHKRLLNVAMLFAAWMFFVPCVVHSEDYTLQYEVVYNSSEAEIIVRYGDIDNMGFGWPEGFDLFSGESTPVHSFPWQIDSKDAVGTDRIMVVSSYGVMPLPCGYDGYTSSTSRPDNEPQQIQIPLPAISIPIEKVIMQIFVDDFQAPVWCGAYEVTMNGMRVPELEQIINSLNQTGPIGKLITFQLPSYVVSSLKNSRSLGVLFDDTTTGAGDGFAFDFFRILFNPKDGVQKTGTVMGSVYDANTNKAISNASVSVNEMMDITTGSDGYFELMNVPAGLAGLTAMATGYESKTEVVDVVMDTTSSIDFYLVPKEVDAFDPTDSDKDGVIDEWDRCINTPAGSYVNRYGCPNDSSTSDCNEDDINHAYSNGHKAGYDEGYEKGKRECTNEGNDNGCANATLSQNLILHIPMIKYDVPLLDTIYIWADLKFTPMDEKGIFFELTDYGMND